MAKQLQLRRGTTAQHSTFTGAVGEITVDTDKDVVVVHDGSTAGGIPLAKQTTVDTKVDKVTSTDNAIARYDGTGGTIQNSSVTIDDSGAMSINTPELITNGTFDSDISGWSGTNIIWNSTAKRLKSTSYVGYNTVFRQDNINLVNGLKYTISFTISNPSANTLWVGFGGGIDNPRIYTGVLNGSYLTTFTADTSDGNSFFVLSTGNGSDLEIDNISVKEVPLTVNGSFPVLQKNNSVIIDNSGNVGIGVTPSGWGSGQKTLEIGVVGNGINNNGSANNLSLYSNAYNNSGFKYANTGTASLYNMQNGAHYWYTAPSGTAGNAITWTNPMTFNANGNLLVGTSTDNGVDKLQVNGSIRASSFKTDAISEMFFYATSGSTNKIQIKLSNSPANSQWYEFVINAYCFHYTSPKNVSLVYGFYTNSNTFTPEYSAMNDVLSNGFSVVAYTSADNKPCLEITRTDGLALLAKGTIKQIGYNPSTIVAQVNSTTRY